MVAREVRGGPIAVRLPGDTIDDALPIAALPFTDTGNTCAFNDDYDEMCPHESYLSGDVVYSLAPVHDEFVHIRLCDSHYDTKLYVYENVHAPGQALACSDDRCGGPNFPDPHQSYLYELHLVGGNTYYIVVDGQGGDCGEYALEVSPAVPCALECLPGDLHEAEPECADGYVDVQNRGCEGDPPVFQPIDASPELIALCGQSGTYWAGQAATRDEDWYEITPATTSTIVVGCAAEFPVLIAMYDADAGCAPGSPIAEVTAGECESASLVETLDPGTYWLRVAPDRLSGIPCGVEYVVTLDGYTTSSLGIGRTAAPAATGGLLGCHPNPFAHATSIRYRLFQPDVVSVEVYDVGGRLVRALVQSERRDAGEQALTWDGRSDAGQRAGAGVYYCRVRTGTFSDVVRILLLE